VTSAQSAVDLILSETQVAKDITINVSLAGRPVDDSEIVGGDGLENTYGTDICSAAYSASANYQGANLWYVISAGHCDNTVPCRADNPTPWRHDEYQFGGASHTITGSAVGFAQYGPLDALGLYVGSTLSPSADPDASRYVRGSTANRPILSFSDSAFAQSGVTLHAYGATSGLTTNRTFYGIGHIAWTCGSSNYTFTYQLITLGTTSACSAPGDSGGSVYGIYWPFTADAGVSVMGVHKGSYQTGYGQVCIATQPWLINSAFGITGYEF
jgi:hypothetical protein